VLDLRVDDRQIGMPTIVTLAVFFLLLVLCVVVVEEATA
jgi:hypothetical protein